MTIRTVRDVLGGVVRPVATLQIAGLVLLLIGSGDALAAQDEGKRDGWRYDLSAASFHSPGADLDAGGQTELTSYHFQAAAKRRLHRVVSFGAVFTYGYYDRGFSGEGFAALRPWDDTERLSLHTALLGHPSDNWTFGIRPFATSFSEEGSIDDDSLSYGIALAAVSRWSDDRRLGVGVKVTERIDNSTKVTPFLAVNWRFNEQWRLHNPSESDLIGATGVELEYTPAGRWGFALLAVYLSPEIRLDDEGLAPGGIGEHEGAIALLRADRQWASGLTLKGYIGALFDGSIEVRNAAGRVIARAGYDTTPLAGLALEQSF